MPEALFDLRSTHNPHRYHLPVTDTVTVGRPGRMFMFGGVGLAAAIEALEGTTGRAAVWATAQYLSLPSPDRPSISTCGCRRKAASTAKPA